MILAAVLRGHFSADAPVPTGIRTARPGRVCGQLAGGMRNVGPDVPCCETEPRTALRGAASASIRRVRRREVLRPVAR